MISKCTFPTDFAPVCKNLFWLLQKRISDEKVLSLTKGLKICCFLSNLSMLLLDHEKKLDQCGMICSWLIYVTCDSSPRSFPGAYKLTFSRKALSWHLYFFSFSFSIFLSSAAFLRPQEWLLMVLRWLQPSLSFFMLFKFPAWNSTKPIWKQLIYVFEVFFQGWDFTPVTLLLRILTISLSLIFLMNVD